MIERYKIIQLIDNDEFTFKYKFIIGSFAGMKPNGKPVYTVVKQVRNEKRANEYIEKRLNKENVSRYI